MRKFLLCIWLFLNIPAFPSQVSDSLYPQQEISSEESNDPVPLKFEEDKIQDFKKDPEFDYTEKLKEENWWTRFKRYVFLQWMKIMHWLFGDLQASPFLAFIIKSLPYLLVAFFIGFLVFLFTKLNPASSLLGAPKKGHLKQDEEENIIRYQDIKSLIAQAVANREYNMAVRYHFLYILQQLSENGFIEYDRSKTDEDYLFEIQKENLKPIFRKLSRIYDFVWYGQFDTGEEVYYKISKEFTQMEFLINTKNE